MATFTEIVAAVVVHSSTAAFSHFGVTLELPRLERPAAEQRIVARTPRQTAAKPAPVRLERAAICPDQQKARAIKV